MGEGVWLQCCCDAGSDGFLVVGDDRDGLVWFEFVCQFDDVAF